MLASSWGDPVLGIDIHWEFVPMPAPVPTPIPNPFTGVVFDPIGLAVGLAISNGIGMAMGGSFKGPVTYWGVPATNTGTEAKHVPGHILIPPGTGWAPVPKTPKPKITAPPRPEKPVTPSNDAVVITGSKTVHVMGANAARFGDMLLSCSEPVRLPSSVILSVPKGAPILIGGPPALDLMAAAFASLRTRFIGDSLQAGISHLPIGARGRAVLSWIACKLTGHPVDVATGKVMTRFLDAELPGPLPLRIERFYMSNFAARSGPLGCGWSSSLDQAVWEERGKVVCLLEDGREIEFDTFDRPEHVMQVGDESWHPIDRLTLRREAHGCWRLTASDGVRRDYAPLAGAGDGRAHLTRIVSRCGYHTIAFSYDAMGRLEWVRDSAGRLVGLEHDASGRLHTLKLPEPHQRGWSVHRRYEYDNEGDLSRVFDANGQVWTFEYVTHLLVRESDRTGLSFYFEYDGLGADAWCTRTWGDGGIFDHVISYDKANHVTFVRDSLGHRTTYQMNVAGLVTSIVDPLGASISFAYDPRSLSPTRQTDKIGRELSIDYDSLGCVTAVTYPDGARAEMRYAGSDLLSYLRDRDGRVWRQRFDARGRLVERIEPKGRRTRWSWSRGLVRRVESSDGSSTTFEYDGTDVRLFRDALGGETRFWWTALGQVRQVTDARGTTATVSYDREGRLREMHGGFGPHVTVGLDAEGNAVSIDTPTRRVRLRYGCRHRLVEREEAGMVYRFAHDTEGRLVSAGNAAGEPQTLTRDPTGTVIRVIEGDRSRCDYGRDAVGRLVKMKRDNGQVSTVQYDALDRVVAVAHDDGTAAAFGYDPSGRLVRAANGDTEVLYEYDAAGRLVRERRIDRDGTTFHVDSTYDAAGRRRLLETSLGARQAIERDDYGRVIALHHSILDEPLSETTIGIGRDALGAEIARLLPGGLRLTTAADAGGRPVERRLVQVGEGTAVATERLTWIDERIASIERALEEPRLFEYDAWGRLSRARSGGSSETRKFPSPTGATSDPRQQYGPGGQLLWDDGERLEYDGSGNVVRRIGASGEEQRYHWNGAGQLARIELPGGRAVRFAYDAFGRRIRKTIVRQDGESEILEGDRRFFWDGSVVVHELATDTGLSTWHWEPGTFRPIVKQQNGRSYSIVSDVAGVPERMLNERGQTVWLARPAIDGRSSIAFGAKEACPWRGEGLYEDAETGLFYNHYRYFDPKLSRYLSRDPIGIRAGLDCYAWLDNPLLESDPLGLAKGGGCGSDEPLPPNHAVISLSDGHASIAVVVEGGPRSITTHQILNVPDNVMERLQRRAGHEGPSAFNGQPTRITSDPAGFAPHTQVIVPFPDADAARAARAAQMEARGATRAGRSGGNYGQGSNSCVTHCNDVLQAGGVNSTHPTMNGYQESLEGLEGATTRAAP